MKDGDLSEHKGVPKYIESRFGRMFLIEHLPDGDGPNAWVIALNAGLQNRTGPRRLYVHLARHLAERGIGVVRVDLPGVGDSDGPPPRAHFDCHDPADVRNVIDYVDISHKPSCVMLLGLCAGAGGIKGGISYGETDDFSYNIAKDPVAVRDLHATILHQLGIDHERLVFPFQGLDHRLTGVEPSHVVRGILE